MKIGHKIVYLDSVDSTNNYVAKLSKASSIEHGTAILADVQTAGKGQRGSLWQAKTSKNILLSIFLKPDNLSVSQQVLLTFFAANSIREILRKFGISATVKWPNDVFVGTKKIAGILIENSVTNQFITSSILGIGLNVNQLEFEGLNATSLQLETGVFHQRNELLFMLLNQLSKNWELVLENSPKLKEDFVDNMFRINQRTKFEKEGTFFYGIIRGIDKNGLLLIEVDGSLISFDLKEIKFVL